MKRIITVTSGKGGVGKTNITMNLAAQMAKVGVRTCVFDADLGLANINILLGITPEYNLEDVITGERKLADILVHDPCGVDIIPGGSGIETLTGMTGEGLSRLITSFSCLENYDVLFFDTSAGIGRDVISFCMASKEVVLIIQPEPTSLTDGYSLLKVLTQNGYRDPVKVIINQAKSECYAENVFAKFKQTVKKYLSLEISYVGSLPADEKVADAVTRQRPLVTLYPSAPAAKAIVRLVRHFLGHTEPEILERTFQVFWKKYADFANNSAKCFQKKSKNMPLLEEKQEIENTSTEQVSADHDATSRQILAALNMLVSLTKEISETLKETKCSSEKQTKNNTVSDLSQNTNASRAVSLLPSGVLADEGKGKNKKQPTVYSVKALKEHPTKIHILPNIMINREKGQTASYKVN